MSAIPSRPAVDVAVSLDAPLNASQMKTIATPYGESTISKVAAYSVHAPKNVAATYANAAVLSLDAFALAGGTGGCVGGAVGAVAANAGLQGFLVAGGLGIAVVSVKVGYDAVGQVERSREFREWVHVRAMLATDKAFMDLINVDPLLQYMKCPISGHLPEHPVSTPDGHTFDLRSLETWRRANPNQRYKGMDTDCADEALKFDFGLCNTLAHRFHKFQIQAEANSPLSDFSESVRRVIELSIRTGYANMDEFRTPEDRRTFETILCVPREVLSDKIDQRTTRLFALRSTQTEKLRAASANLPANEQANRELVANTAYATIIHQDSKITQMIKWLFNIQPNVVRTTIIPTLRL